MIEYLIGTGKSLVTGFSVEKNHSQSEKNGTFDSISWSRDSDETLLVDFHFVETYF